MRLTRLTKHFMQKNYKKKEKYLYPGPIPLRRIKLINKQINNIKIPSKLLRRKRNLKKNK